MPADYWPALGGSRICDSNRVDKSLSDDADVTDWARTDDFIFAVNINSNAKDTTASQHKLRWRNVTTNGSFADVGATGEIHYNAATILVNGAAIVIGDRRCDSQGGDTWQNGREVEGASLSAFIDLLDEYETEIHFGLDCSGGSFLNEYEFELWNTTEGASKGTCGATITLGIDSSAEIIYGEENPVLGELKKSWYVWQNVDGDQSDLVGGDLISLDYAQEKIYKHVGFTSVITDSFSTVDANPSGLAWDGYNLYSVASTLNGIYKHSGLSDTIEDCFSSPSTNPEGVSWDGTNLISSDYNSEKIYKHDGFSDVITDSFSSPSYGTNTVVWVENTLYSVDSLVEKIYKHLGFSDTILDSFSSPSTGPGGIDWDGENLLSTDAVTSKIYKHDGFSDVITDSFSAPNTYPAGLTMDKSYAKIRETVSLSPVERKGIGKYIRVIGHRYGSGYSNYEVYLRGHHSTTWEQTAGSSNLLSADDGEDKIYKHSGFSSTITDSFSSPSTNPCGLTWDGTNLISVDFTSDDIYKHTGFSSTILDSFSSPSNIPRGLTWDGTNLLSADDGGDKIYKHTGFSSTITDSFSSPSTDPFGLAWDGSNVLSTDAGIDDKIYKHSGFSSTITDSFSSPSTLPVGLTWDGTNLLSTDYNSDKIYKHSGFSSTITDSFSSPFNSPYGLAWDGPTDWELYIEEVRKEDWKYVQVKLVAT